MAEKLSFEVELLTNCGGNRGKYFVPFAMSKINVSDKRERTISDAEIWVFEVGKTHVICISAGDAIMLSSFHMLSIREMFSYHQDTFHAREVSHSDLPCRNRSQNRSDEQFSEQKENLITNSV